MRDFCAARRTKKSYSLVRSCTAPQEYRRQIPSTPRCDFARVLSNLSASPVLHRQSREVAKSRGSREVRMKSPLQKTRAALKRSRQNLAKLTASKRDATSGLPVFEADTYARSPSESSLTKAKRSDYNLKELSESSESSGRGGRPAPSPQGRRQGPAVLGARARRGGVPRRRRLRGDALGETDAGPPRGPLAAHGHGPLPESRDGRRPPERRVHARDRRAQSVSRGAGAGSVSYAFDFAAMASSSAPHR